MVLTHKQQLSRCILKWVVCLQDMQCQWLSRIHSHTCNIKCQCKVIMRHHTSLNKCKRFNQWCQWCSCSMPTARWCQCQFQCQWVLIHSRPILKCTQVWSNTRHWTLTNNSQQDHSIQDQEAVDHLLLPKQQQPNSGTWSHPKLSLRVKSISPTQIALQGQPRKVCSYRRSKKANKLAQSENPKKIPGSLAAETRAKKKQFNQMEK